MSDAMVTGRMSQQKKQAATRVLESLGLNASQVINQLYDYLIVYERTPFLEEKPQRLEADDMARARDFIHSMQRPNMFSTMSDSDIKRHKARAKGYALEAQERS